MRLLVSPSKPKILIRLYSAQQCQTDERGHLPQHKAKTGLKHIVLRPKLPSQDLIGKGFKTRGWGVRGSAERCLAHARLV